jgi:hypothetical protein
LHKIAVVATEHFPLFDGRHHSCHRLYMRADPEQGPQPMSDNCRLGMCIE